MATFPRFRGARLPSDRRRRFLHPVGGRLPTFQIAKKVFKLSCPSISKQTAMLNHASKCSFFLGLYTLVKLKLKCRQGPIQRCGSGGSRQLKILLITGIRRVSPSSPPSRLAVPGELKILNWNAKTPFFHFDFPKCRKVLSAWGFICLITISFADSFADIAREAPAPGPPYCPAMSPNSVRPL